MRADEYGNRRERRKEQATTTSPSFNDGSLYGERKEEPTKPARHGWCSKYEQGKTNGCKSAKHRLYRAPAFPKLSPSPDSATVPGRRTASSGLGRSRSVQKPLKTLLIVQSERWHNSNRFAQFAVCTPYGGGKENTGALRRSEAHAMIYRSMFADSVPAENERHVNTNTSFPFLPLCKGVPF